MTFKYGQTVRCGNDLGKISSVTEHFISVIWEKRRGKGGYAIIYSMERAKNILETQSMVPAIGRGKRKMRI